MPAHPLGCLFLTMSLIPVVSGPPKTTVTKSECNEEVLSPSHLQKQGLDSSAEAAEEEHLALENC